MTSEAIFGWLPTPNLAPAAGTLYAHCCACVDSTMEQCSLFLPLLRGAGPMALMLWLNG
jgi:hypothetical protein